MIDKKQKCGGYSYENMMQLMKELQKVAIKNGTSDMSLEEINKEIYGYKYAKRNYRYEHNKRDVHSIQ